MLIRLEFLIVEFLIVLWFILYLSCEILLLIVFKNLFKGIVLLSILMLGLFCLVNFLFVNVLLIDVVKEVFFFGLLINFKKL